MTATPKVKAFLLCDQVLQSTDGKHSVIGVFQRIHAPAFPVFHARFGVYIRLGEMRGRYTLSIRFVEPKSERMLGEAQMGGIQHERPLDDFETGVNLPGIEVPAEGTYEIHLLANGELLHVDTFRATKVDIPGFTPPQQRPPAGPAPDPFSA